ncbi:hypothetical protein CK503_11910 [Aliifodinibius salipaludis]|uniref:Uncharacterized protein n=1 Tax=Fodinibius salipaludis TaxID=2032627 RepID=A0A2A2G9D7_9BACT|nr:hypothetical protein [Aliifodinibius salipaludis]PAU93432.1 hypothetical protein CK503_11910 [Aliifodinibius salipaludis]
MTNFRFYYFFAALLLLGVSQTEELYGQSQLGVVWDIPSNTDSANVQLQQFHELGVSILEIDTPPTREVWNQIDRLGFNVYGNLDINFPVTHTFSNPDSSLITHIENNATSYLSQPSVKAIGLFNYGSVYDPAFWESVTSFAEKIKQTKGIDLYHKSRSALVTDSSVVSFSIINIPVTPKNVYSLSLSAANTNNYLYYTPSDELKPFLKPFKNFVSAVDQSKNNTIFVDSGWLLMMVKTHPQFTEILQTLSSQSELIFPLPNETIPTPDNTVLPMVLLLLIWGSLALHYNTSPLYRKSLFRYFTAHKFFIDDIFKRLIRSPMPAVIIILQNALLLSTATYVVFSIFLTPIGQEAFFHHFPELSIAGNSPLSIFIWTFLLVLLISLSSIIWLYFSHKKIKSFTQIATVYAWPLQLNFLFCTAAITFFSTSESKSAALFTAFALLLFLLSYNFSALDIIRFARSKIKHLFKTAIPYTIIIAGILIWFSTNEQWMDVLTLALNLT